ncbi:MAG TPA: hypothetical protein PK771_15745 [Spirochaetota bacterium]|nr:hypothetical protein [Spirochaetota bacterium]
MNFRDLLNVSGGNMGSTLNMLKNILTDTTKTQSSQNQIDPNQGIEELALLFETLYNLLVDKGLFTNDEFQKKFNELDMIDGVKDNKHKR